MATKIYGSLTGSSSAKYNLWLAVTENSQDIVNNSSNLTVKLQLKRNDGYADSAYNLYENTNSVKLNVAGSNVVNKYITIDTRNCVTVTLASWTGDVKHKADGTLNVSITGTFAMDSTSLAGGTVTGTFECTDIPRISEMTFNSASVNVGGTVTGKISSASEGFSHKTVFTLGGRKTTASTAAGESVCQFTVPLAWANEITSSKSAYMSVVLYTYNGTKKIGTKSYSVKVKIPNISSFLPEFQMSVERVDGNAPPEWEEYVKGVSKVKVNVNSTDFKYGAALGSYSVSVGDSKAAKIPCTFSLTKAGSVTVSVTVTDSRGYSSTQALVIDVMDYSPPSVTVKSIVRCDEHGNVLNNGTYLLVDYALTYSSVNSKNVAVVKGKYRPSNIVAFNKNVILAQSPAVLGNGDLNEALSYVLAISVYDGINENEVLRHIPSAQIPFNIRTGGNGASFGCYAENDNELKIAWDMNLQGLLNYESLEITYSEIFTDVSTQCIALYFPALRMCFIRLRGVTATALEGNKNLVIASIQKSPTLFTPLNVFYNSANNTRAQGGIKYDTGEIFLRFDSAVPAGETVYISGFCFLDRKEKG